MGSTSVPSISFTDAGFVAPAESDVLAGVQADTNAAFGGGLNPALTTPQGQLASSWTAIIGDANDQKCALFNGVDPALASGRMQDALGRIYFMSRNPATSTTIPAKCSGLPGTDIPAGSMAADSSGNLYASTADATIGAGGTVTVNFACTVTGPVACPSGALNTIYRVVPGWDSVTNSTGTDTNPSYLGANVESREAFEARRQALVAKNSVNATTSIRAAVWDVTGVVDAYVYDNSTAAPVTLGGVTIPAGQIYVCYTGSGVDQAVANAIWTKKPPGIPMYNGAGAVSYTVTDTNPLLAAPLPTYTIWQVPAANLGVKFTVTLTNSAAIPSDAQTQIANAINSALPGGDGGPRARIGGTQYAARYVAPIVALGPWASALVSVKVGSANSPHGQFTGSISGTTLTVSAVSSGALAVGDFVSVASGGENYVITALGTGTGGTGTYTLACNDPNVTMSSVSVASTSMIAVTANSDTVAVNINQFPVTSVDRVNVVLQ